MIVYQSKGDPSGYYKPRGFSEFEINNGPPGNIGVKYAVLIEEIVDLK